MCVNALTLETVVWIMPYSLMLRCAILLLLCVGLNLAGCAPKKIIIPSTPPQTALPARPAQPASLKGEADRAWNAGNMTEAERLYATYLQQAGLSRSQRETACYRLASAALANTHSEVALGAVQQWKSVNPAAAKSTDWLCLWGQTVMSLPKLAAQNLAQAVIDDLSEPAVFRAQAGGVLMFLARGDDRLSFAQNLTSVYTAAGTRERSTMERSLVHLAGSLKDDVLDALLQYTLPDTDHSFPWSVLLLEKARREMGKEAPDTLSSARERINGDNIFSDAGLVRDVLSASSTQLLVPVASRVPLHAGCYALALPMSGSYAGVGRRIAAGAEAAQQELDQLSLRTVLQIIDTNNAQWTEQLANLPPQCVAVGGPLLPSLYKQAKARNLLSQRAFFTFLSTLEGSDEGTLAWRFFSSPADQVKAVAGFAREVGITRFATLYPEEPYGERMSALFRQAVQAGSVTASASYPPKQVTSWNGITARLLGRYNVGKTPASSASFQAVFLPDSWNNAALLIPYIFFNGEDRLLLMGTALWEQRIAKGNKLDPSNTRLAIFPGSWNQNEPSPAAKNLATLLARSGGKEADVWTGLGYDFVRFAAALHLQPGWNASSVNEALLSASQINWSIAPISWSWSGVASQKLFVFTPEDGKPYRISPGEMRSRIEQARSRYARRVGRGR